ncbi:MAG: UbiA family prenyltransferase [Patescibacteria group bacterium]|nr:UbiA family prenyltransferase [Patescibacteria group bacterium]
MHIVYNEYRMRTTAKGLIKLTRYQEYLVFVTINTILGFLFADPTITLSTMLLLGIVLIANMLSVCFSFMINDVEDAPDDAKSPEKATRNPISAGTISRKMGLAASFGVAMLAIIAYYPLGTLPFIFGIITVLLGFLYSWKAIRLKSIPIVDLITHGFMLSGLQFLCSYFTFSSFQGFEPQFILPLIFITSISMYGELYNEVRDFTYDRLAGINHTANVIGKANAHVAMYLLLSFSALTLFYSIFLHLIPMWVLATYLLIGGLFFLNIVRGVVFHRYRLTMDIIQDYILVITCLSLMVWTGSKILGFS